MLFLSLIIYGAVFFFIRFFIINSLQTKVQRTQTLHAAIKAIYYTPVFQQGVFLFCAGIIYFFLICRGFFLLLCAVVFPNQQFEPEFLLLISIIGIGGLLLSFIFILAKISMNYKTDVSSIFYKVLYLLVAIATWVLIQSNLQLLFTFGYTFSKPFFYNNPFVIIAGAIIYFIVLLLSFFYKANDTLFRYIRLSAQITFAYFIISFILAVLFFIIYLLLKLVA